MLWSTILEDHGVKYTKRAILYKDLLTTVVKYPSLGDSNCYKQGKETVYELYEEKESLTLRSLDSLKNFFFVNEYT